MLTRIKNSLILKFMQSTLRVKTLRPEKRITLSEDKRTPMQKRSEGLQRTLDVQQLIHNVVFSH
jgi:hypothetical protein